MAEDGEYRFAGFGPPAYTQVPDLVFDELLSRLTESELKVLLYIIRRTYGFKKSADDISLKQLVEGIVTTDGRQLDYGAGVSRASAVRGAKGLVEKGIILAERNRDDKQADTPTTYRLRFRDGEFQSETGEGLKFKPGGVSNLNPQETVVQETVEQETDRNFENSKDITTSSDERQARNVLTAYVKDYAREFGDQAPLSSSITRMVRIQQQSGLSVNQFIDLLYTARARTQEHSANIKATVPGDQWGRKNRMPYFFSILSELAGLKGGQVEEDADEAF